MSELICSVNKIFTNYLTNGNYAYFNIPDYQRGYKWNANDATKLLDDFNKFENSNPKDGDFYCLQNITLVPSKDGKSLNVVDGQQRLTTLYILLSFYKNCRKIEAKELESKDFVDILKYSIRESTADKLKRLNNEETDWGNINPSSAEHRDEFYILTVAESIKTWFAANSLKFDTVWNKLKLIVNKIEGKSEETIFANINGGKVPLDGADLVRAILMTKSAKEKFSELKSTEKTNQFCVRMGMEIDGINQWWSNEDVKTYYAQFISGAIQNDDLFKKDFSINLLYKIFYEIYKDNEKLKNRVKHFSFDFFEYGTDFDGKVENNYYEMYQKILSLHLTLKDWYNNSEIYHLLGYLFFNFKDRGITLKDIWTVWGNADSKSSFVKQLKQIISKKIESFEVDVSDEDEQSEEKREKFLENVNNISYNWYDTATTEKLLPLMDVIYFIENQGKGRLPVGYLKKAGEQKEHIMCQHPREDDENRIKISKKEAEKFINDFFKGNELKSRDSEIKKKLEEIVEKSGDEIISPENQKEFDRVIHDYCLNSIGNIVLLDSHVNESYGNAPHNQKVTRITSEFFGNNHYIRPFTVGVFLEKNKTEGMIKTNEKWHWGIAEIRKNATDISRNISEFLGWKK
ncbi:MAG: DUF262 domain-containing protein [Treponema sp.]|nr:DUF262 domain-containing protein [Treponema sp.]